MDIRKGELSLRFKNNRNKGFPKAISWIRVWFIVQDNCKQMSIAKTIRVRVYRLMKIVG